MQTTHGINVFRWSRKKVHDVWYSDISAAFFECLWIQICWKDMRLWINDWDIGKQQKKSKIPFTLFIMENSSVFSEWNSSNSSTHTHTSTKRPCFWCTLMTFSFGYWLFFTRIDLDYSIWYDWLKVASLVCHPSYWAIHIETNSNEEREQKCFINGI